MTLTIGLSSGARYPGIPTERFPAEAARLGFQSIELMLQTTGEYDAGFLRMVQRETVACGVAVHGVHLFQPLHPFFTDYTRRTDEALDLFRKGVAGSASLGAKLVVWHGPTRHESANDPTWGRFLALTNQLAGICGEYGLVLGIENVSWCALAQVRDVIRLASSLSGLQHSQHVGFVFDSFQVLEAGANPFMMLAAMEGRIANVHISDGRAGDDIGRHLIPGQGEVPWPALIKAIDGAGYAGPMMLEAHVDSAADVSQVRNLIQPMIDELGSTLTACERPLPAGVHEGIALFNAGKYYEAHEVIEHEWHAERSPVRALYQGILQIGVGLHHARNGNHRGAELLLGDGIDKVSGFVPRCQGVNTAALVHQATQCLDMVLDLGPDRLGGFNWALAPQIETDYSRSR